MPTEANLLPVYRSFASLVAACVAFCTTVNGRLHRETGRRPDDLLALERSHLHALPDEPYAAALGETRLVNDDQTIRWGGVRYSVPRAHVGSEVWVRVAGDEIVIVARGATGLAEIARHLRSTPGQPCIDASHYPDHPAGRGTRPPAPRAVDPAERSFLALGPGAHRWLLEAASRGVVRIRGRMRRAVDLAALLGSGRVDAALAEAALAGRFGEEDLASILEHLARRAAAGQPVWADEAHSVQPGTGAWARFGR